MSSTASVVPDIQLPTAEPSSGPFSSPPPPAPAAKPSATSGNLEYANRDAAELFRQAVSEQLSRGGPATAPLSAAKTTDTLSEWTRKLFADALNFTDTARVITAKATFIGHALYPAPRPVELLKLEEAEMQAAMNDGKTAVISDALAEKYKAYSIEYRKNNIEKFVKEAEEFLGRPYKDDLWSAVTKDMLLIRSAIVNLFTEVELYEKGIRSFSSVVDYYQKRFRPVWALFVKKYSKAKPVEDIRGYAGSVNNVVHSFSTDLIFHWPVELFDRLTDLRPALDVGDDSAEVSEKPIQSHDV